MKTIPSKMSLRGHPIHPMLIHFPVAALLALAPADLAFILTQDFFWARASLWLVGVGTVGGWFSGLIGLIDLAVVKDIRRLITGWCHGLLAVMLLSLASLNWLMRVGQPDAVILPWGLYLSLLTAALIAVTASLGGRLVYEHAVGVELE